MLILPQQLAGPARLGSQIRCNYKSADTLKYLIGISPSGLITFASQGYTGRSSDAFILNDGDIVEKLEKGDTLMADKGFPLVKT